jgi:hypothetical protein
MAAPPNRGPEPPPARTRAPATVAFAEVIGSVPVEGAHQVYQNLHLGLAALIHPRPGPACDSQQAESFVGQLEPKVAAEVLSVLTSSPTLSPHKLEPVRAEVAARAQAIANQMLGQLAPAPGFDVEVVVTSLYLTDATIGR